MVGGELAGPIWHAAVQRAAACLNANELSCTSPGAVQAGAGQSSTTTTVMLLERLRQLEASVQRRSGG